MKIISVVFKSTLGFIKKPDINDYYPTFNTLHKPGLLGILGAITGMKGFYWGFEKTPGSFPEYYLRYCELLIGIKPAGDNPSGIFNKTMLTYSNTVGYANKDESNYGTNLLVTEQILIAPEYKIYILINSENEDHIKLYNMLKNHEAVYIPYLGKNEFQLWWEDFTEYYEFEEFKPDAPYRIDNLFIKPDDNNLLGMAAGSSLLFDNEESRFLFERLPIDYDKNLKVYNRKDFVMTNLKFQPEFNPGSLYRLEKDIIIQLY